MSEVSAGLLLYRAAASGLEVFLAHPGGPFFAKRDSGAWTIPKGAPNPGEALIDAAIREFAEEVGVAIGPPLLELGHIRQKSGKVVHAWASDSSLPADFRLKSNEFEIEWPRGSGKLRRFPEIDRAEFFPLHAAEQKLMLAQLPFLERLSALLGKAAG